MSAWGRVVAKGGLQEVGGKVLGLAGVWVGILLSSSFGMIGFQKGIASKLAKS